jgi:reactive intermediate/imine deaminase
MQKHIISTQDAPQAIGTYSQAVAIKEGTTVYLSGQIPLDPKTMELASEEISQQIHQAFKNLTAVCKAAGGNLNNIVKLNIYLTDLSNFATVNEIMSTYFDKPYPARAAIGINQLPKDSKVEMDGIMAI